MKNTTTYLLNIVKNLYLISKSEELFDGMLGM